MPDLTPKTRRLIVFSLGIVAIIVSLGWIFGPIDGKDALLVITSITAGFMGILKGVD